MEIIVSEDGESLYEAYHSIFSKLISTDVIYEELATKSGAEDVKITKSVKKITQPNTIYCKKYRNTVHYIYCSPTGEVQDPYAFYQLPMSEGNCFAFALYLASKANQMNLPLPPLVYTRDLMNEKLIQHYWKIADDPAVKQRAYQTFVHNDFLVIQWLNRIIQDANLLPVLKEEWNTWEQEEKEYYGIPLDMSFDDYWKQWLRYSSDMQMTYLMTKDQITNWDENVDANYPPNQNSGIEDSHLIDFSQFTLPSSVVGGKKKSKSSKSKSKSSKSRRMLH